MGCTAEILAISGDDIFIGHIGDSRTYRLRNAELKQLSADHFLVARAGQTGAHRRAATPGAMRCRHVILRAVGCEGIRGARSPQGQGPAGRHLLRARTALLTDMADDAARSGTLFNTVGHRP
ncbi:MAG: hypothetical protein MZV70_53705 [Desulfobacterales bacterium]|nr:hypothetical protein [Desulfobacterales bacterium]